jgi:hypothetical protein
MSGQYFLPGFTIAYLMTLSEAVSVGIDAARLVALRFSINVLKSRPITLQTRG